MTLVKCARTHRVAHTVRVNPNSVSVLSLPGWICDLIDTAEWLHTGSRMSTLATERTEILGRSERSAERAHTKTDTSLQGI